MLELFSRLPLHVDLLLVMLLMLAVMPGLLPDLAFGRRGVPLEPASRSFRRSYLASLTFGSVLMLSACGTAPSTASPALQVPAELMEPPQKPVLLPSTPRSPTPGTTTPKTPPGAASTGRGISA